MLISAIENAELVAWICFGVGLVLVGVGTFMGLVSKPTQAVDAAEKTIQDAKQKIELASERAAFAATATGVDAEAAGDASITAAAEAKSALEQVSGIVASLPEHLRFAGMLVLIGAVLVSVATVQFGGVSLF